MKITESLLTSFQGQIPEYHRTWDDNPYEPVDLLVGKHATWPLITVLLALWISCLCVCVSVCFYASVFLCFQSEQNKVREKLSLIMKQQPQRWSDSWQPVVAWASHACAYVFSALTQ